MTLRLRYHPDALAEIEAGVVWYETRELGLGRAYFAEVERVALGAAEAPSTWPLFSDIRPNLKVRRRVLRTFPYVLAYKVHGDALVVIAVSHARRRPGYGLKRV